MPLATVSSVSRASRSLDRAASLLQSPLLLAVRLYWGWQFAQTGWGKLHHLGNVTSFFTSLGLPLPHLTAIFIAVLEFAGGILLIAGLASRWIGLLLVIDMTVAYWVALPEALHAVFSDPGKFYGADVYTFWFASLLILVFGPGRIALDAVFSRAKVSRRTAPAAPAAV